jgi:hypothetical protein
LKFRQNLGGHFAVRARGEKDLHHHHLAAHLAQRDLAVVGQANHKLGRGPWDVGGLGQGNSGQENESDGK